MLRSQPPTAKIPFSPEFLKLPNRSHILREHDLRWEKAHKLLPQLCYRPRSVKARDVLEAYQGIQDLIEAIELRRLKYSHTSFHGVLAYAHVLAGLLAWSWIEVAYARTWNWYDTANRALLPGMVQAMLDHFAMADDLEGGFASGYVIPLRQREARAAIACAMADVTAKASVLKRQLPMGCDQSFMRDSLLARFEGLRENALKRTAALPDATTSWLRACALGLEDIGIAPLSPRTEYMKHYQSLDPTGRDILMKLRGAPRFRLHYIWSRAYRWYLEHEGYEYGKAEAGHRYVEIMPPIPGGRAVANMLTCNEQADIDAMKSRGVRFAGMRDAAFLSVIDNRLITGMIYESAELKICGLVRRVIYHAQYLRERNQAKCCVEAAEAALGKLKTLSFEPADINWLEINLTAHLARALVASGNDPAAIRALNRITKTQLKSLNLKDRWHYHYVAAPLLHGVHASLATRGLKLARGQEPPKPKSLMTDARHLMALWAKEAEKHGPVAPMKAVKP